ncbi:hypothetical protein GCM10010112_89500 [Actinoplanes lobatus]|uniref:MFS family permease n=1 Tax=Actinoplanes lobatus TaxID=113568 RepID=A0A7W7HJT0_9ACTN|nr:MFS transporter [Actinoplanes lobatus]MBB4751853.1 MFS family permease [Actinoplanes lobatus]GGN97342.1 hypothetical protein GCM10010112_89500 [Actinoplanes lobatus]GIE45669.1 hypothetical protein Alo02nite_85670 [Actinoplanes lobatus]
MIGTARHSGDVAIETPARASGPDLSVGVALAVVGYLLTGIGGLIAVLARDLAVPVQSLTWISSAFAIGLLVVAPLGGLILRRGPGLALRAAALIVAAGATLLALAPNLATAVAAATLTGLGTATIVLAAPALLTGPTAGFRLTRVNGAASAAAILAPAGYAGLEQLGLDGRLALLATLPLLLVVVTRPVPGTAAAQPAEIPSAAGRPPTGVLALRWSRLVLVVGLEFCFTVFAVTRLRNTGAPMATAAALAIAFPLGMALGRTFGSRLIQRIPAIPLGAGLAAAAGLVTALTESSTATTLALLAAGLGVAPLYPLGLADLMATPGLHRTAGASLGAFASGVAILIAPNLLARLAVTTDLRAAFLVTVPLAAAAVATWLLDRRRSVTP